MITRRGKTYHLNTTVYSRRYRCSLGTNDEKTAGRLANTVAFALTEGPQCSVWPSLRAALPKSSFRTLTANLELPAATDLSAFEQMWENHLDRRKELGEIGESTRHNYLATSRLFFSWLIYQKIQLMDKVTPQLVETYLIERKEALAARGGSGRGIVTLQTILNALFDLAMREGIIRSNPIKYRLRPDSDPPPVQPFTAEEMTRLETYMDDKTRLPFLVFSQTGMRISDVAALTWSAIDWEIRTLRWKTKKRGRHVQIPLAGELWKALVLEYKNQEPDDQILEGATRANLYSLVKKLGEEAEVRDCHPHKFRTTFCCEMLSRGMSLFDVAKLVGDSHAVVERHYAAITEKQQERVRNIIESAGQNSKRGGIVEMEAA